MVEAREGGIPHENEPKTRRRILIVDDEKGVSLMLQRFLEARQAHLGNVLFDIVQAEDGSDGLEKFTQAQEEDPFAIVFTDFDMPHKTGPEMVLDIRKLIDEKNIQQEQEKKDLIPQPPIVLTTGRGEIDAPEGVNHVLGKPYRMQQLFTVLDTVLEGMQASVDASPLVDVKERFQSTQRPQLALVEHLMNSSSPKIGGEIIDLNAFTKELADPEKMKQFLTPSLLLDIDTAYAEKIGATDNPEVQNRLREEQKRAREEAMVLIQEERKKQQDEKNLVGQIVVDPVSQINLSFKHGEAEVSVIPSAFDPVTGLVGQEWKVYVVKRQSREGENSNEATIVTDTAALDEIMVNEDEPYTSLFVAEPRKDGDAYVTFRLQSPHEEADTL